MVLFSNFLPIGTLKKMVKTTPNCDECCPWMLFVLSSCPAGVTAQISQRHLPSAWVGSAAPVLWHTCALAQLQGQVTAHGQRARPWKRPWYYGCVHILPVMTFLCRFWRHHIRFPHNLCHLSFICPLQSPALTMAQQLVNVSALGAERAAGAPRTQGRIWEHSIGICVMEWL